MKLSRLRTGEAVALVSAVSLAVLLGARWYVLSTPIADIRGEESGIAALGWPLVFVIPTIALALALAFTTVTRGVASGVPVVIAVLTSAAAALAALALLLRLVFEPGLGVGAGDVDVDLLAPPYLAVLLALGIAAGAWRAMGDEKTGLAEAREQRRRVLGLRGEGVRPAPPASPGQPGRADPSLFDDPSR